MSATTINADSDSEIIETEAAKITATTESVPDVTTPMYGPEPEKLGKGCRQKKPPTKLSDYVASCIYKPSPSVTPYPIDYYVSSSQFSDTYQAYLLAITSGVEPQHYQEAILDENWRFAVKDEIEALEENETWTVEDLPPGKKPIG